MLNTVEPVAKPVSGSRSGTEQPSVVRFTSEQYHKLAETGILQPDKRYELIRGFVYQTHPVGSEHSYIVMELAERLRDCARGKVVAFTQSPIKLPDDSEPEPNIVLLKPPSQQYRSRLPEPADILLIVEVSKSTLLYDRTVKLELYARAGIPEFWLLNLNKLQLEVYRNPDAEEVRYRELTTYDEGRTAAPGAFAECALEWWN
ncbi:Uma2 family endonuclease [soil metagenome]